MLNNKNNIRFSIIIPIYNVEQYIEEAISSCINQTYNNVEIICIDDKGSDNSINIVNEYAKKHSNIIIIDNIKNLGLAASRDAGLKKATGDYILFLDSDDKLDTQLCEKLSHIVQKHPNINIVEFNLDLLYDNNVIKKGWLDRGPSEIKNSYEIDIFCVAGMCNKLWKKSFISQFSLLNKSNIYNEDFPFAITACLLAKEIYYFNYVGYFYRHNENSITRNNEEAIVEKRIMDMLKSAEQLKLNLQNYNLIDDNFIIYFTQMIRLILNNKSYWNHYIFPEFYNTARKEILNSPVKTKKDFKNLNLKGAYKVYIHCKYLPLPLYRIIKQKNINFHNTLKKEA